MKRLMIAVSLVAMMSLAACGHGVNSGTPEGLDRLAGKAEVGASVSKKADRAVNRAMHK